MAIPGRAARRACRAAKKERSEWRIRVSIPVPRRCERRTLPIELIPLTSCTAKSLTGVGFEPTPPKRLVPKTSALDHSAIQPSVCKSCSCRGSNPGPSAHKTEALPTAPQELILNK